MCGPDTAPFWRLNPMQFISLCLQDNLVQRSMIFSESILNAEKERSKKHFWVELFF